MKKENSVLIVSESLYNHPSNIINTIKLRIEKEGNTVLVLPYPDKIADFNLPDHLAQKGIEELFVMNEVDTIFYVEKNPFINSFLLEDHSKKILLQHQIRVKDYSELVNQINLKPEVTSSQGKDALLIYKRSSNQPFDEPEFRAALEICKHQGAIGVAVIMYEEIPYESKQEWVDQLNVIEPGFVCSNDETEFLHEVLESSNISEIDVAIITTVQGHSEPIYDNQPDIQKMS